MKIRNLVFPVLMSFAMLTGCNTKHNVPVESITLNQTTLNLDIDETFQLTSIISPDTATNKDVIWSIESETIASINNGLVRGLSYGSTKVFCSSVDGNAVAECSVTVLDKNPAVEVVVDNTIPGISVSTNKETARPGETVTLRIANIPDGYEVNNLALKNSANESVTLNPTNIENEYTYSQTSDGHVVLNGNVEGKMIRAYVHDSKGIINGDIKVSSNGVDYEECTNKDICDGVPYYNVRYGQKARIDLKTVGYYIPTGIKIDGEFKKMDGNNQVFFDLTLEEFDSFFFDIEAVYKDTTPITGSIKFVTKNSANITAYFFDSTKTKYLNGAEPDDVVYIETNSRDAEFCCSRINITYTHSSIQESFDATRLDDGWFTFKVPNNAEEILNITLMEGKARLMDEINATGEYIVVDVGMSSSNRTYEASVSTNSLSVYSDGYLVFNSATSVSHSAIVNSITADGYLNCGNSIIPYEDGSMMFDKVQTGNNLVKPSFGVYEHLAIKKVDSKDLNGIYTVDGETVVTGANNYSIIRVLRNGQEYKNVLIDYANKEVIFNVEVELIKETSITSEKAYYDVKKNNQTLVTIGYETANGVKDHVLLNSDIKGVYTGVEGELFVHGLTHGVFKDIECAMSISENEITVIANKIKYQLVIDNEVRTYTVKAADNISEELPVVAGKKFFAANVKSSGSYAPDYNMYVEFSATDMTMSFIMASGNINSTDVSTNIYTKQLDLPYEFGKPTKTSLTVMLIGYDGLIHETAFNYNSSKETLMLPEKWATPLLQTYTTQGKGVTMNLLAE